MKTTLLVILSTCSFLSFGQKHLKSTTWYAYEMNGDINSIDSTFSMYTQQQVGLPYKRPEFAYDGIAYTYTFDSQPSFVNVSPNQVKRYGGVSHPLVHTSTSTNTIANGLVVQSGSGGNVRTVYEYDAQDNLVKLITEFLSSNTWIPLDSATMTYDLDGNRLTFSTYDVTTLDAITYTDTSEYLPGTNLRTKFVSYLPQTFGGSLEPLDQVLISYNGSNIEHLDSYYYLSGTGFVWNARKTYEYNGSTPIKYENYFVVNNTVFTSPNEIVLFQSNAQNLHFRDLELTPGGDTVSMNTYHYDPEGFVVKAEFIRLNFDSELYLEHEEFFYYEEAPLSLTEQIEVQVVLFPNPTSDVIYIEADEPIESVQLLSSSGQVLIEQHSSVLDVEHLASGNYFLVGFTNSGRFVEKIVKN